jgi:2-polyprenyl-3-methyl-5-hydroxy-6-metoxy-1,4-benzoquinol methylase
LDNNINLEGRRLNNNKFSDYRTRIYNRYPTNFLDASEIFNIKAALRWGQGYSYYLRDWLPLDKNADITDVACGGGNLLHFFKHKQFKNVSGIDISPEQVKLARQVTSSVDEANVLDWLEEHPSAFDLITGLDIIEHFNKSEVLHYLEASYNALKPGGNLILQTLNAESPWSGSIRYGDFTHEVGFTPDLLSRLLNIVGFQDMEIRETGPVPWGYSLISSFRYLIWQSIRLGLKIWNLAETGSVGSGVFTRVFLIRGLKTALKQSDND